MGTKHVHYDVIVAWAAGEEVEFRWEDSDPWRPIHFNPAWTTSCQYRIKPKRVRKEGWVNVYPVGYLDCKYMGYVWELKEDADKKAETEPPVACVHITWEEQDNG